MNNFETSYDKQENFENIYGKHLILSYKKIGKVDGGCHIRLSLQNKSASKFLFVGFLPLSLLLGLHAISSVSTVFYITSTLFLLLVLYLEICKVESENVTILPHIGIQYTIKYQRGNRKNTFIQWQNIKDVIINEVIFRQRVIYLITILVNNLQDNLELVPLFQNTKPRLKCCEEIYKYIHSNVTFKEVNDAST